MRSHVLQAVSDQEGNLLINSTVTVYGIGGAVMDQTLYYGMVASPLVNDVGTPVRDDNGDIQYLDQELSNPFTTQDGVIEFWLDAPARLVLHVSPADGSPAFDVVYDALPAPSELVTVLGGMRILNTPTAGQVLYAIDASTAHWVDPPSDSFPV